MSKAIQHINKIFFIFHSINQCKKNKLNLSKTYFSYIFTNKILTYMPVTKKIVFFVFYGTQTTFLKITIYIAENLECVNTLQIHIPLIFVN